MRGFLGGCKMFTQEWMHWQLIGNEAGMTFGGFPPDRSPR